MNPQTLKTAAWLELAQYVVEKSTKRDDEITAEEFAEMTQKSISSSKWTLKLLETEGKVTSRIITYNGTKTKVYCISTSDSKPVDPPA